MVPRRYRVLVVDDSVAVVEYLRGVLEPLNLDIDTASDGLQAWQQIAAQRPDLVITDVEMARMSGLELCQRLRAQPSTHDLPVVIVSAFDSDSAVEQGFQAGAAAYLAKAHLAESLLDTVQRLLSQSQPVERRRILVVDDSKAIRDLLRTKLEALNFAVAGAEEGGRALEILRKHQPDLILSDISMPGMDGFELCQRVKRHAEWRRIPFVAMSTHQDHDSIQRMLYYGAASYLLKPFAIEQLVLLINKLVSDVFLAILHEKEQWEAEHRLLLSSISSLVTALETRDAYTRGHSDNVARMVEGIARLLGLPPDEREKVTLGARLHDIGKIGIRDNLLFNDDPLTPEEYARIQEHPRIGAMILKPIPSLAEATRIVYHHHERWDGSGYPKGLKGEEIPFWARVTGVVDTYDALTTDRPYQNGRSPAEAVAVLQQLRGVKLCPRAVDLFLQWLATGEG